MKKDLIMKLKVTREGGFTAQVIQKQIDTSRLPENMQSSLASFVKQKHAEKLLDPLLRDGYQYTVQWSGEETKGKIQFDEANIPKKIGPIIHYMIK
jgi:hypothetical protein